jgi:D-alanyl-D-alanine carboxypeptidase
LLTFTLLFSLSLNSIALSARGSALVEASTGRLIKGQNVNSKMPMASTTKIMTGLIACESGKLDTEFSVPEAAIRVEGSSIGLVAGEKLTLREITYGLLLESGNDAANVIAFLLGGSLQGFAEIMNKRAEALGLTNTHFENPSGLDGKAHYTTALDLARLGAAAMKNKDFAEMASTYVKKIPYNGIKDGRYLKNHNALLKTYDGTIGIKTGYTKKSGRCLVTCAERGGVRLVAATLNGWDDWGDHITLLDIGFQSLKMRDLEIPEGEIYVRVTGGSASKVKCAVCPGAYAALRSDEIERVNSRLEIVDSIKAPVENEQKIGEVIFSLDGAEIARANILTAESVALAEKKSFLKDLLKFFKIE